METSTQHFQALQNMDQDDQEYYRGRFKEALEARIVAKIGNGRIHGLHHFAPQTVVAQLHGEQWYLYAIILDVDRLVYAVFQQRPTHSEVEAFLRGERTLEAFSLTEQLSLYQQLACGEWIDFPASWKAASGMHDNIAEARQENAKKDEKTRNDYRVLFYHGFEARFEAEWGDGIIPGLHDFTNRTVKITDEKDAAYYFSMIGNLDVYILPEANLREDEEYTENPSIGIEEFSLDEQLSLYQQLISHPFIDPPKGFTV